MRAKTKVNLKPELKKMKVVRNAYERVFGGMKLAMKTITRTSS